MKIKLVLALVFTLVLCNGAVAQTDVVGTWQGKLAMSPNEKLTIQFVITKQPNGTYAAVLNSTDTGGIKNVSANAVKFVNGKLTIEVASLSGSYAGTLGKGEITGEWQQEGSKIPLVLTPYRKPEASSLKPLIGEWVGLLQPPGTKLSIVFRFETGADGKFKAFLDVPDQGAKDLVLSDVTLEGAEVRLKYPAAGVDYVGKLSGNTISGTFKQSGAEFPLNMTKGKYQVPGIDLPEQDAKRLLGLWGGKWKLDEDLLSVYFRFEKNKEGKLMAATNCPEQGQDWLPLADLTLKGDQLTFKIPRTGGEYNAKLTDTAMTGAYKVAGKEYAISVTRGAKLEGPITQIDLPAETMKMLLGRWTGKLGNADVVMRFERNAAGKNAIFADVAGSKGVPALKASFADGKLTLRVAGAKYEGRLAGDKIDGSLMPSNQNPIPLVLTKQK